MERTITVLTDLKDLSELLHGATLQATRGVPAGGALQLIFEFTRELVEHQPTEHRGWRHRVNIPRTPCELRLSRITTVTVRRSSERSSASLPLLSCDAVPGGYQLTVQAPDGLQVVVGMTQLDGTFADLGTSVLAR